MTYHNQINRTLKQNHSFTSICNLNIDYFPKDGYSRFYDGLERGRAILQTAEQCNAYMACYADMHTAKLNSAFNTLFNQCHFTGQNIEVIDWGCGQAMATCALYDFIQSNDANTKIRQSILIEPSSIALNRGGIHVRELDVTKGLWEINKKADVPFNLKPVQSSQFKKIHLFSNILDMPSVDLDVVIRNVIRNFSGENYFVCVSPLAMERLELFFNKFKYAKLISRDNTRITTQVFRPSAMKRVTMGVSLCQYIFKVNL